MCISDAIDIEHGPVLQVALKNIYKPNEMIFQSALTCTSKQAVKRETKVRKC